MADMRAPTGPSWPWAGVMRTRLCMGVCIRWEGDTCIRWLLKVPGGGAANAKEQNVNNAAVAARVFFMASSFRTACFQTVETGKRDFRLMKDSLISILIYHNR